MNLTLTITRSPEGVSLDQTQRVFNEEGGDIGRAESNSWVLNDPERYISSRHCSIEFEEGVYYLVDCSTNGTFLGGADEAMGKGQRAALSDGMNFCVGDYEFAVTINAANPDGSADNQQQSMTPGLSGPFAGSHPVLGDSPAANYSESEDTGLSDIPLSVDSSLYDPVSITPHDEPIIPGQGNVLDPLQAFEELDRKSTPNLPFEDSNKAFASQPDNTPFADQAFTPPNVATPEVIPDDWDMTEYGYKAESKFADKQAAHSPSSSGQAAYDFELEDTASSNDVAVVANKPKVKANIAQKAVAKKAAVKQKVRSPQHAQSAQGQKSRATQTTQSVSNDLLVSMGLDQYDMTAQQKAQLNHIVGQFVRHTVEGLIKVLRARSTIKNELRMGVTTVQPRDNNPMKFSADVDDAMEHLFVRQGKAYLPPVASVNESFETILDHQVAVLAGMRAAFKSLIERFDPLELTQKFEAQNGAGIFSGPKKMRNWEMYNEFYKQAVADMDSSFQHLFGDEFIKAYESQLVQLSIARNQEKQEADE